MLVSPTQIQAGKPYAVNAAGWARVVQQDGSTAEIIQAPRTEMAPQIVYGTDGTQYYAIPKGATIHPSLLGQGAPIIIPQQHLQQPQQVNRGINLLSYSLICI